jgi:hypothetical protein
MPYPIKDVPIKNAPFGAEKRELVWLDGFHLLFRGFQGGEGPVGHETPLRDGGAYIWNLDQGTATRAPQFDRATDVCSREPYLAYTDQIGEQSWKLRLFENGKEIALPDKYWFNLMSCRFHAAQPPWSVEGRVTIPLLEEHGYLDRGIYGQDTFTKFPLLYYRPGAVDPHSLGLDSMQVARPVRYAPFLDAYLLEGTKGLWGRPLWILHPNGTVEQIFNPEGQAWAKEASFSWLELSKRGPVFASLSPKSKLQAADAGLYLWANGVLMQVAEGYFTMHAVSPDGCKLAVIKSRPERPLPAVELHRLQIVDLCEGETHVHNMCNEEALRAAH